MFTGVLARVAQDRGGEAGVGFRQPGGEGCREMGQNGEGNEGVL